ncbi:NADH:ubiquinone oxidoreductase subunit NDUFA12 [Acuticoccus sediminis]|uniref:NADH:ubiquinone oxidoreductase subunit NDUFA12 n=1 Tax=Acuticoccus sediminis TaxID=2184697 RepID=A0A8B2NQX9_9HYPH|nr:NADH:ubiquinone oxidoreductase subunit NDUFA12 [Acuticoccus sediminis]RAH99393.1 NADH:ubiquinone oxidoreductase subunit NDUFA12 [Acuticoccus sediminis]
MAQTPLRRLLQVFTWWNGTTIGTSWTTYLRGEEVGTDQYGNRYFRTKNGKKDPALGYDRRWVIYKDQAEATMIPPGWYRWMHHLTDLLPEQQGYVVREWEKPHQPNLTGTAGAHRPTGSIFRPDPEAGISAGYDAWTPGEASPQ